MDQSWLDVISSFGNKQITQAGLLPLTGLIGLSLVSSFIVSYLYVHFYKERSTGSEIHRSFPLLGLSITAIFICIQFSLPLSLGLLGALSIVRFRTPIKEPEEIGFLMLLIATSISCATFNLSFLGSILVLATAGLLILKYGAGFLDRYMNSGVIILTVSREKCEAGLDDIMAVFTRMVPAGRVDSISTSGATSTITFNFHKLETEKLSLLREGLRTLDSSATLDVFYNNKRIY